MNGKVQIILSNQMCYWKLMHRRAWVFVTLAFSHFCYAQNDSIPFTGSKLYVELGVGVSNTNQTPFWLQTNQYGTISKQSPLGRLLVGGHLSLTKRWHIEVEGVVIRNSTTQLLLSVGNLTYQNRFIHLYAGRKKEVIGIGDTLGAGGSYIWSSNALPLPKIHIGTSGFVTLPFARRAFAVHATIAHGWFGNTPLAQNYYLHQKTLYIRIGKPQSKLHFYTGLVHMAQWGGKAPLLIGLQRTGPNGELPSSLQDFWYVFTAKGSPAAPNISLYDSVNRIGNHLGSLQIASSFRFKNGNLLGYFQRPIETDALISRNFPDGQYGLKWTRKNQKSTFSLSSFTVEYLTTLKQNLRFDTRWGYFTDSYFNNSQYMDGWTYKGRVIGTPIFSTRDATRAEWYNLLGTYADKAYQQINGNSVNSLTTDLEFTKKDSSKLRFLFTHTQYHIYYNTNGSYGKMLTQNSGLLKYSRIFKRAPRVSATLALGIDLGEWLEDSMGLFFSINYTNK